MLNSCKDTRGTVSALDLLFATKFLTVYLFIKVKGSRPMTYQYLTVEMVNRAKTNGGFIDQKMFKTAGKYGFDSHASVGWPHQSHSPSAQADLRLCFSNEERKTAKQAGRTNEQISF